MNCSQRYELFLFHFIILFLFGLSCFVFDQCLFVFFPSFFPFAVDLTFFLVIVYLSLVMFHSCLEGFFPQIGLPCYDLFCSYFACDFLGFHSLYLILKSSCILQIRSSTRLNPACPYFHLVSYTARHYVWLASLDTSFYVGDMGSYQNTSISALISLRYQESSCSLDEGSGGILVTPALFANSWVICQSNTHSANMLSV